jgi:hypothetical protein
MWNNESLLDQCLKAGADPRVAIVTAKKLTVMELAKQNGQSNLYKKLLDAPFFLQNVGDAWKSLRNKLEDSHQVCSSRRTARFPLSFFNAAPYRKFE